MRSAQIGVEVAPQADHTHRIRLSWCASHPSAIDWSPWCRRRRRRSSHEYGKLRRKAYRGNRRQGLRPEESGDGLHGRHGRGMVRVLPLRIGRHPGVREGLFPNAGTELDGIIAAFLTYAVGFVA